MCADYFSHLTDLGYVDYTDYVENTESTSKKRYISIDVDEETWALVKKAAHRKEMTLAQFVRLTLKEAAEFYVRSS